MPTPVNAALADLLDATASDPVLRAELARRPARIAELVEAAADRSIPVPDHRDGGLRDAQPRDRDPQPVRHPPAARRRPSSRRRRPTAPRSRSRTSTRGGPAVNAKDALAVLSRGKAAKGDTVRIVAEGEDEEAAIAALRELIESGLGETLE